MAQELSDHPPGTIVLALGEFLRYSASVRSLMRLEAPPGSGYLMKQSPDVVANLNNCIREALDGDKGTGWVHIQADDHVYTPDLLLRLLNRDVDVIVPLIYMRSPPFRPVVFKDYTEGEGYMPYRWGELPEQGLMKVFAAGTGGMLIRRRVLDAIGDPWFQYVQGGNLNEDLIFCRRVREAGFDIWLDVDVQMGHCGTFIVAPDWDDSAKRWDVRVALGPPTGGKTNTVVLRTEDREVE